MNNPSNSIARSTSPYLRRIDSFRIQQLKVFPPAGNINPQESMYSRTLKLQQSASRQDKDKDNISAGSSYYADNPFSPEKGRRKQSSIVDSQQFNTNNVWAQVDFIIKRIKFKKFIKRFLGLSRLRMQRFLNQSQLNAINDLSYCQSDNLKGNVKHNRLQKQRNDNNIIPRKIRIFLHKKCSKIRTYASFPVFLPNSGSLEIWQILKIMSFLIVVFAYLVCFSFKTSVSQLFPKQLIVISQLILIFDILVNLNTGIYVKGILCTDRRQLLLFYKNSRAFFYDIISNFSIILYFILRQSHIFYETPTRYELALLLTIILKHNDLNIVIRKVKSKFLLDRKIQNLIELVNLLKNILLFSHIFACIWLWAGKISETIDFNSYQSQSDKSSSNSTSISVNSWFELLNLQNSNWYVQYIYAYYFISVTMITVGYGEIRPTNPLEVSICTILMMVCCVIFGFTINQIGEIFQDFFSDEKKIQEKRYIIGNYMDKKGVTQATKKTVFEYLEYFWKEQIEEHQSEEDTIIAQLSDNLKEKLLIESNRIILKQNKILSDNFSADFLLRCLPIIHEQRFTPGQLIIDEETGNVDCCLFFLIDGELEIYHDLHVEHNKQKQNNSPHKVAIHSMKKGEQFGEKSFFCGERKSLNVRSVEFSKVLKIKREDFIDIVEKCRDEYEKFCMISDKIRFSNDVRSLYLKCYSCGEISHQSGECPTTHFTPSKLKIFGFNQISEPILERGKIPTGERSQTRKGGALELYEMINESVCEFIEQNIDDIDKYEDDHLTFGPEGKQRHLMGLATVCEEKDFSDSVIEDDSSKRFLQQQSDYQQYPQNGFPNNDGNNSNYPKHKQSLQELNEIANNRRKSLFTKRPGGTTSAHTIPVLTLTSAESIEESQGEEGNTAGCTQQPRDGININVLSDEPQQQTSATNNTNNHSGNGICLYHHNLGQDRRNQYSEKGSCNCGIITENRNSQNIIDKIILKAPSLQEFDNLQVKNQGNHVKFMSNKTNNNQSPYNSETVIVSDIDVFKKTPKKSENIRRTVSSISASNQSENLPSAEQQIPEKQFSMDRSFEKYDRSQSQLQFFQQTSLNNKKFKKQISSLKDKNYNNSDIYQQQVYQQQPMKFSRKANNIREATKNPIDTSKSQMMIMSQLDEDSFFDIFFGRFEKLCQFEFYYPKDNYKNIVLRLQSSPVMNRLMILSKNIGQNGITSSFRKNNTMSMQLIKIPKNLGTLTNGNKEKEPNTPLRSVMRSTGHRQGSLIKDNSSITLQQQQQLENSSQRQQLLLSNLEGIKDKKESVFGRISSSSFAGISFAAAVSDNQTNFMYDPHDISIQGQEKEIIDGLDDSGVPIMAAREKKQSKNEQDGDNDDEPLTPPRNEEVFPEREIASLSCIRAYNFASAELSNTLLSQIRKDQLKGDDELLQS